MRARQLNRFLDAQFEDTVAVWIVLQILIRRLAGRHPRGESCGERAAMLRTAVAARLRIARTDVWN
jgi:hypothetical protein